MSTWSAKTAVCHSELGIYSTLNDIAVKTLCHECSVISMSRNKLVRLALGFDPACTHILWVDSVTAETPILVRSKGEKWIDFIEACELIPESERFQRKRTYAYSQYETLTNKGWQKINAVMQARVCKPILRITDESGVVCVTEDHSLISNGEAIAGRDVSVGTVLDHMDVASAEIPDNDIPPVTEEYAEVLGFFAAEGTAGQMRKPTGSSNGWFWNISNNNIDLLKRYSKTLESAHARRFFLVEDKHCWRLHASRPGEIVGYYISMFYTATGKKRVPKFILNAPENIVNAFLRGYELGDGHLRRETLQVFDTNSQTLAAGLHFLYARIGRDFGVSLQREDKPTIIKLFERAQGKNKLKSPPGVRHIQRNDEFDGWVYDLNTDAGTFVGGVGLHVLHNSDMTFPYGGLQRLLAHDKDIVGAFYNRRMPPYTTVGHLLHPADVSKGGLHRADIMPHGFVLAKREVYEKLPPPWYSEGYDPVYANADDPDGSVGEDVSFSRKAVAAGIEIWCDADLTFEVGHIGEIVVPCLRPEPIKPEMKAA